MSWGSIRSVINHHPVVFTLRQAFRGVLKLRLQMHRRAVVALAALVLIAIVIIVIVEHGSSPTSAPPSPPSQQSAPPSPPSQQSAPPSPPSQTVQNPQPYQLQLPFSGLNGPGGVAVDSGGNVYVAEFDDHRVLKLPAGSRTPVEPFTSLDKPAGLAVDTADNAYVADFGTNGCSSCRRGRTPRPSCPSPA